MSEHVAEVYSILISLDSRFIFINTSREIGKKLIFTEFSGGSKWLIFGPGPENKFGGKSGSTQKS
jgi:hypothetical protein